jgi:hypothetical protein
MQGQTAAFLKIVNILAGKIKTGEYVAITNCRFQSSDGDWAEAHQIITSNSKEASEQSRQGGCEE